MGNSLKHFLNLSDLRTKDIENILEESHKIKKERVKNLTRKRFSP